MQVELDPLIWDQEPTRVGSSDTAEQMTLWECQVFGTHYRGLLVRLPVAAERLFGLGAQALVAVEPSGGAKALFPNRMWATFDLGKSELHQRYVEQKFACQGEDAVALTFLVAAMLDRHPTLSEPED